MLDIDIFCNVVDNFGNAGVCLRLARVLSSQFKVTLWCNHLQTINTITTSQDRSNGRLTIREWNPDSVSAMEPGAAVIMAFSCRAETILLEKLRARRTPVINLEYFCCEDWVEGMHTLSAPADGLNGYYFFPGVTGRTGGMICEPEFKARIEAAAARKSGSIRTVTLFSYANPRVAEVLRALENSSKPALITVFAGKALDNINQIMDSRMQTGDEYSSGRLTFRISPMLSQEEYDQQLLNADLNLVRGEDSIARAMLAGRPFLWQIYPQEENYHLVKLDALFTQMSRLHISKNALAELKEATSAYNSAPDSSFDLSGWDIDAFEESWQELSRAWSSYLTSMVPLQDQLTAFIQTKLAAGGKQI